MSPRLNPETTGDIFSLLNISHRQFAAIELDQPAYAANTKRRARNSARAKPSSTGSPRPSSCHNGRLNDLHQRKRHGLYDTSLTVRLRDRVPWMNPQPSSGIVGDHGCARVAGASCQALAAHSAAPEPAAQLSGEMVLQRAGQTCLDHLMRNEQAACTGDAESIHQMRVAVRRWRATLSALAPFVPPGPRRSASNELRWIADALSEARNLDVFASSVLAPARAALPAASEFERLAMAIDRRRQTAHAAARTAISSARYSAAMGALANWLEGREWRAGDDAGTLRRPIGELAPILLSRCHRQAKKRGESFAKQSEEERHRLRIALKKLRYAAELLGNLYEPAMTIGFIRRLKQLQDDLGDLNDVRVARDIVASLADPNAPNTGIDHAGRRIIAWHKRRLARTEPKLRRRLRQLLKTEPFWIRPALSDDFDQSAASFAGANWPDPDGWRPLAIGLGDRRL